MTKTMSNEDRYALAKIFPEDTASISIQSNYGDFTFYENDAVAICQTARRIIEKKDFDGAVERYEDIAVMMAQELQDFVDAAEESGSPLPAVVMLLEDFEKVSKALEVAL